jgi:hypothetical protein
MMSPKHRNAVRVLLIFLVVLDIVLSTIAICYPETWFRIFHGVEYVDPQGLLRRTGALWVAFTLFQAVALFRWEKQPYWLAVVAGIRLTELFSDWTYLYFAQNITTYGRIGLLIAPPGNLLFGWYLIRSYLKAVRNGHAAS